ncbi:site-2 protease family protein [Radiobacillus deserti]|uniref:Peptidase M50 domain-containing protein n=1 Tax=Radiobacillus deserti TaxID=2594883 RepID=A0A516KGJ1_9BACI|nr:site-2 protease family protein [Radiobacillus deserti]QDP40513.1 hypothetical protein FN924_10130 [Radiobacillus deserti]
MVNILLFVLIIGPISILLHELGHCFAAFLCKADDIELTIGRGRSLVSVKKGKLRVNIKQYFFLGGYSNYQKMDSFHPTEMAVISFAGPFFNLLIFFSTCSVEHPAIQLGSLFNLWLCIINLIPFNIAMQQSDGYKVIVNFWNSVR